MLWRVDATPKFGYLVLSCIFALPDMYCLLNPSQLMMWLSCNIMGSDGQFIVCKFRLLCSSARPMTSLYCLIFVFLLSCTNNSTHLLNVDLVTQTTQYLIYQFRCFPDCSFVFGLHQSFILTLPPPPPLINNDRLTCMVFQMFYQT